MDEEEMLAINYLKQSQSRQTSTHLLVPVPAVSSVKFCDKRVASLNTNDFYSSKYQNIIEVTNSLCGNIIDLNFFLRNKQRSL